MPAGKKSELVQLSIPDIVAKAENLTTGPGIYSNFVQMAMTGTEIILDFYQLTTAIGKAPGVKAYHVQRVSVPVSLGKGFVTALANSIDRFEKDNGSTLPNQREPDPEDRITVWP